MSITPTLHRTFHNALSDISQLKQSGIFLSYLKIKRLSYIQIGSEVVVKEYPDRREYAVWEEVLNACLKEKYIERKSEAICVITNAGYKVVE